MYKNNVDQRLDWSSKKSVMAHGRPLLTGEAYMHLSSCSSTKLKPILGNSTTRPSLVRFYTYTILKYYWYTSFESQGEADLFLRKV